MKKIIHIITGLNKGGAEGVLFRLCINNPSEHCVISLTNLGYYGPLLQKHDVPVYEIGLNQNKPNPYKLVKLYKVLKKNDPTLVQTWMYHADLLGGLAAKAAGVPKIFWGIRHGNLSKGTVKLTTFITMKACAYLSSSLPTKIISCSKAAVNSHIEQGYDESKFEIVQNGYDLSKFRPSRCSDQEHPFSLESIPIIGMVARFDIQKDHGNLLSALSILKKKGLKFHLVLVGTGMEASNLELLNIIKESTLKIGKDITLLGQRNDIPLIMSSIDLHVLSSLGEGFPNVLAEAMACGTPCVSTDVGDAKEVVSNYGWIAKPQDSLSLANAIDAALKELMFEQDKWQLRKQNCIKHIKKNFELEVMINSFCKVWAA